MLIKPLYNTVLISSIILKEDFGIRKDAYLTFFPDINDCIIKEAIRHFQINISNENIIKYIDLIYYFCD